MKLSDETLTVLKNFSSINPSVLLKKGKVQKTMAETGAIMAVAELEDDFPADFGVYDLNSFLANLQVMNNPDLKFGNQKVVLDDGQHQLSYRECAASNIKAPPDKELVMKQIDAYFALGNESLQRQLKLAAINNLPFMKIGSKNGKLFIKIYDKNNDLSNDLYTDLGQKNEKDFEIVMKTEYFKFLPDDYKIDIMVNGFAKFTSKAHKLTYYIAIEATK